MPVGAQRIGVGVFNAVLDESGDKEKARIAAWSAIKNRFEKSDDGTWREKTGMPESDIQVRSSCKIGSKPEGRIFEAVLIAPGLSLKGQFFSAGGAPGCA